jgi:hypothetical protein
LVDKAADGELEAVGVAISHTWIARDRKYKTPHGLVSYPRLRKGDLVPAYSNVYEVTSFQGGNRNWDAIKKGQEYVELKRVPAAKVPAGLALGTDPLILPLGGRAGTRLYAIEVKDIPSGRVGAVGGTDKPVATLELGYLPQDAREASTYAARVRAGDTLLLGGVGHKVRNVVPKDDKTKAIGWVELAPEPIPKADLVRDMIKFVELVPLDSKDEGKPGK